MITLIPPTRKGPKETEVDWRRPRRRGSLGGYAPEVKGIMKALGKEDERRGCEVTNDEITEVLRLRTRWK
jgi:hypothetical protein